jgi:hypothetical protein
MSNQGERMQRVKNMTKQVVFLAAMGYLALHVGTASPVLAAGGHCNQHTLNGTYVWTQDGFENRRVLTSTPGLPTIPDPITGLPTVVSALVPSDRRPFAYAGRERYNGRGRVVGINTLAQARGATANPPTPPDVLSQPVSVSPFVGYTGTYAVNPDCTAVVEVTDDPDPLNPPEPGDPVFVSKYHLFLSPDGEKFTFILFSAAVVQNDVFVEEAQEITGVGVAYRVDN